MAQTYEIKYGDMPVGTARIEKQGLYLSFSCRCRLPEEGMYRIHVISGVSREDLGICIPKDGVFGMDKKIPAKRLGTGSLEFVLVPKDWKPSIVNAPEPEILMEQEIPVPEQEEVGEPTGQFIPVSEEEPFDHLDKLENAHMEIRDDQPGIVIDQIVEV